jgi:macrolide transport system ATP-binding/permease protein
MRWRKRMLKDLDDDIRDYLERETQDNIDRGMPAEEARFAALRKFGNVRRVKEEAWKVWSIEWLECLLQDFRFALRSLRKAPGHTASVVLTLALGLGSVATMLAIVDSVLLRPVAIPRPHELVMLYLDSSQMGMRGELAWSQIEDLQRNSRLFTSVAGYTTVIKPVGTSNGTGWAMAAQVTPGFFRMLNVQATLGRLPELNSTAPAAVVSQDFWQERLGLDPHAVGSVIHLEGEERTIIGVLPRSISVLSGTGGPVVYTTISQPSQRNVSPGAFAIARMQPGVSVPQALAEARSILAHSNPQDEFTSRHLSVQSYDSYLTGSLQKPLFVLLGGVMILLLIGFANAANLQIARTMERMTEMYVRSALGASFRFLSTLA